MIRGRKNAEPTGSSLQGSSPVTGSACNFIASKYAAAWRAHAVIM